jgi:hypothetical protein
MNIAKLILGNLDSFHKQPSACKELMNIIYQVVNNQNGGKLPELSDNLQALIFQVIIGDYFRELLENWSRDYDNTRQQPQRSPNFADTLNSKILQGIGKESAGKL